jgi:four helix bundle protein
MFISAPFSFWHLVSEIAEDLPRGHGERAGRWSQADSAEHYKIARGEAMESATSLDVLKLRKLVTPERYERGIQLLEAVVAMLTKRV